MDRQHANVGMNRLCNTCWSAPSCHNRVPMKTWKSSTHKLDPALSIGRESCSDSRRRSQHFTKQELTRMHFYISRCLNQYSNRTLSMAQLLFNFSLKTLAISFMSLSQCLWKYTLKADGPFYRVSMLGEANNSIQRVNM